MLNKSRSRITTRNDRTTRSTPSSAGLAIDTFTVRRHTVRGQTPCRSRAPGCAGCTFPTTVAFPTDRQDFLSTATGHFWRRSPATRFARSVSDRLPDKVYRAADVGRFAGSRVFHFARILGCPNSWFAAHPSQSGSRLYASARLFPLYRPSLKQFRARDRCNAEESHTNGRIDHPGAGIRWTSAVLGRVCGSGETP
jgi:hypothetical protein